jgi:hypothetical protein
MGIATPLFNVTDGIADMFRPPFGPGYAESLSVQRGTSLIVADRASGLLMLLMMFAA